jgi:xanthine dehydrogenase accessory factor
MDEFETVSKAALEALQRGEMVALATVVQVRGSAPRHAGARMLVWPDGKIVGTVGGATLEESVFPERRSAFRFHTTVRRNTWGLFP